MTADLVSACLAAFPSRCLPVGQLHRFVNTVTGKEKTWGILQWESDFYCSNDIGCFLELWPLLFWPDFEALGF